MKTFHDTTPTGPKTSRMVQDKGSNAKPTVGVAGWLVILTCAAAVIAAVVKVGG